MDNDRIPLSEQELLFDPMFAKKPSDILKDDPNKGFFGKIKVKKTAFILVLIFFISLSMYFSFRTVSKDVYTFAESEAFDDATAAYALTEYHGDSRQILVLDYVRSEDDNIDKTKTVREVGKYAVNCNESLMFIFISENVELIDDKAFYTCKNLQAFFVDENNENYKSIDGVLYRCENKVPVEVMFYPVKNPEYHAALSLGLESPATPEDCEAYITRFEDLQNEAKIKDENGEEKNRLISETEKEEFSTYTLPETVTTINELCFAEAHSLRYVIFNDVINNIETMAFFKCDKLQEINIPDSVETIGSDAFSSCSSVKDIFIPLSVKSIGHHAFYNCSGVSVVRMECSEEEAKNMDLGSAWLPESRKVIMRPIGVSYNETREVK